MRQNTQSRYEKICGKMESGNNIYNNGIRMNNEEESWKTKKRCRDRLQAVYGVMTRSIFV